MPVVPLWTALKSRRFQVVIGVVVIGLVGAGLLISIRVDRGQPPEAGRPSAERSAGRGTEPAAARDPLPVGGLQVSWDLPVGGFYAYAMDHATHSIALKDFAIGPDEV